jgi:hypothetical protein
LRVQRIAFFGENVYILHVSEVVDNWRLVLFFCTFESPKFTSIAYVIYYGTLRSTSKEFGKQAIPFAGFYLPKILRAAPFVTSGVTT